MKLIQSIFVVLMLCILTIIAWISLNKYLKPTKFNSPDNSYTIFPDSVRAKSYTSITDRTDAHFDYEYFIFEKKIYVRKCKFPGYKDPVYYVINPIHFVVEFDNQVSPPFVPGGPPFSITQHGSTTYFNNSDNNLRMVSELRKMLLNNSPISLSDIKDPSIKSIVIPP
jgi:hypothetical protein